MGVLVWSQNQLFTSSKLTSPSPLIYLKCSCLVDKIPSKYYSSVTVLPQQSLFSLNSPPSHTPLDLLPWQTTNNQPSMHIPQAKSPQACRFPSPIFPWCATPAWGPACLPRAHAHLGVGPQSLYADTSPNIYLEKKKPKRNKNIGNNAGTLA